MKIVKAIPGPKTPMQRRGTFCASHNACVSGAPMAGNTARGRCPGKPLKHSGPSTVQKGRACLPALPSKVSRRPIYNCHRSQLVSAPPDKDAHHHFPYFDLPRKKRQIRGSRLYQYFTKKHFIPGFILF